MIEFVPRNGPPEAMNCPAVVCDTCRKQVVDKGNIHWAVKVNHDNDELRQQSPTFAAHKGRCDRALEAWLRKQYGDGWIYLWEELGVWLRQLTHNIANDFDDDTEGEYLQVIVKMPTDPHREIPQIP